MISSSVRRTIGCCIAVHRELGPGLLETIYQRAVAIELNAAGIPFERERPFPVTYRGKRLYLHRVDLVVSARKEGTVFTAIRLMGDAREVFRAELTEEAWQE